MSAYKMNEKKKEILTRKSIYEKAENYAKSSH